MIIVLIIELAGYIDGIKFINFQPIAKFMPILNITNLRMRMLFCMTYLLM